jgi:hypothetical protein
VRDAPTEREEGGVGRKRDIKAVDAVVARLGLSKELRGLGLNVQLEKKRLI